MEYDDKNKDYKYLYLKYKNKYLILQNQIGGLTDVEFKKICEYDDELLKLKTEHLGLEQQLVKIKDDMTKTKDQSLINTLKKNEMMIHFINIPEKISEYNRIYELKINLKYESKLFNLLSEKIMDIELLGRLNEMIKEDNNIQKYLILKYYQNYGIFNYTNEYMDEDKPLIPTFPDPVAKRYSPSIYAKRILDHLIKQKNNIGSNKDIKFIILVPGDSPSKIVSFILLIDEYVQLLRDNNIEIILFPLSSSFKWTPEYLSEYIRKLLEKYEEFDKKNMHFGIIDAITGKRRTINSINASLRFLGFDYSRLINENVFGFNMIHSTYIYEEAESTGGPGSRCMKSFIDMENVDETKDKRNIRFKEQLFNCNLFLFYWYKMKDIKITINPFFDD